MFSAFPEARTLHTEWTGTGNAGTCIFDVFTQKKMKHITDFDAFSELLGRRPRERISKALSEDLTEQFGNQ